jgi:hypothetical protein
VKGFIVDLAGSDFLKHTHHMTVVQPSEYGYYPARQGIFAAVNRVNKGVRSSLTWGPNPDIRRGQETQEVSIEEQNAG